LLDEFASLQGRVQGLQRREQRAVERILENERLTADLDDAAAQALLDWGIACARRIVRGTAGLAAAEAEEAAYPRLRATRRLMQKVNRWVAERREMGAQQRAQALSEILQQVPLVYGEAYPGLEQADRSAMARLAAEAFQDPVQVIEHLRGAIEGGLGLNRPEPPEEEMSDSESAGHRGEPELDANRGNIPL
jgi:hypothetical protein